MKKIGITGSLASGKTTAGKHLALKKGPLFNADEVVKKIYSKPYFKKLIFRKFGIRNANIKKQLKNKILQNNQHLLKLEKIIHPLVRKEMQKFITRNKKKKFLFFEIPLLIESKLMKNFDTIFFIRSKKSTRMKRFKSKGGNVRLFNLLNNKQLSDAKKARYCNHIVVNEKNLNFLKKTLSGIFKQYE